MAVDVERGQLILSAESKSGCCGPAPSKPENLHKCEAQNPVCGVLQKASTAKVESTYKQLKLLPLHA
jgi:hypothetical protein